MATRSVGACTGLSSGSRRDLAALLQAGFEAESSGLRRDQEGDVWTVLAVITEDPEPDPAYEARYGGENQDWDTLALNTVRPCGFLAMFAMWFWLAKQDPASPILDEIRAKVMRHLDPAQDRSLAIRAVVGRSIPLVLTYDPDWLRSNMELIFPADEALRASDWATWSAYLAFWRPHAQTFEALRSRYLRAIRDLGRKPGWRWLRDPEMALGQHLVGLYASGLASYEEWVGPFFAEASPLVRASTIAWMGRSFSSGAPEADITVRLMELCDRRLAEVATGGVGPDELAAFGWWFAVSGFDPAWSLANLTKVLELQPVLEADYALLPRLAALSRDYPELVTRNLTLIVEGLADSWRLLASEDSVEAILRAALDSGSKKAVTDARHVIGLLAFRGQRQFLGLLPPS